MGDFRRPRAPSPRQQGQFGSKMMSTMTARRGREDWDAGRRENGASRHVPSARRGRTGWDAASGRAASPATKDRRQDGAESDDDIAAKPRSHQAPQSSLANATGSSRAPALTQPGSHSGSGSSFFKSGAGAPPPDLVRKNFDSDIDIPAPPPAPQAKTSGFDVFSVRHSSQDNVSNQISGSASRPRARAPVLDTQLSPAAQTLPQHRPATPPVPAAPTGPAPSKEQASEFARDPPNGSALEMPSSVSSLSDKITSVQSTIAAYSKDVETLQTTTTTHASLISALQKRMASVVQQAESVSSKVSQLEDAHGKRLSAVEAARTSIEAELRAISRTEPAHVATDARMEDRETVGDTQVPGLPDTCIKSERNGKSEAAHRGGERSTIRDSRIEDSPAAPTTLIDVTPTSPTLQAHPSTSPGESKPFPGARNGSQHGAAAPEPTSRMVDAPWPKRTSTIASDSEASAGIVRIMRAFQEKLADVEQRCTQLAAEVDAKPDVNAPAADGALVESAAAAVLSAGEALAEQKEANASYERRMKRFVQDVERMMRTLQDQMMGIDHYMQMQTSRVDQMAGDCLYHRELLQRLESAHGAAQEQQEELGKRMTEMSAAVTKLQQQQQTLTIQVQKAEAERLKEARRAQEAARAAPAATAAQPKPSADDRAGDTAAIKALQADNTALKQENTALKGRIAVLESMLTGDKLAELVRDTMRAQADAEAKPDASEGRAKSGKSAGKGSSRGGKVSPTEASEAASDSDEALSQDGTGTGGDASAEETEAPRKGAAKQGKKKRKRTADMDIMEGQEPAAEKKTKPGKRTRQGTRGTK